MSLCEYGGSRSRAVLQVSDASATKACTRCRLGALAADATGVAVGVGPTLDALNGPCAVNSQPHDQSSSSIILHIVMW